MKISAFSTLVLCLVAAGCTKDDVKEGEGRLRIDVTTDTKTTVTPQTTYSALTSQQVPNYTLRVKNMDGETIRKIENISPSGVIIEDWLLAAKYKVEVTAGTNPIAAFDSPYYYGEKEVTVVPNVITPVDVVCRLANVKVTVNYADKVSNFFTNIKTVVSSAKGNLTFEADNDKSGFFRVEAGQTNTLTWKLTLENLSGQPFERTGTIENVKARQHYIITFDMEDDGSQDGGKFVPIIVVDDDAEKIDDGIDIPMKRLPEITGDGFDMNSPFFSAFKITTPLNVQVKGTPSLGSVVVAHNCDFLSSGGIPSEFDLMTLNESAKAAINAKGLYWTLDNESNMTVDFTAMTPLLPEGDYTFTFTAADNAGKKRIKSLQLLVMQSDVITTVTQNPLRDTWATSAVLYGEWVSATQPDELGFNYRKAGTSQWLDVQGALVTNPANKTFSMALTGLEPNTQYEYSAKYENQGSVVTANIQKISTDTAPTLPNGDFEGWSNASSGAIVPVSSGQSQFWDSGNHGSITLNKNVTVSTTEIRPGSSGTKAASLNSQFVGVSVLGKFAAGNIFAGQYLRTDGTDGVLGFGRPFTARPTKLRGYYKYNGGSIDYSGTGLAPKGTPDSCHIYIAVGDWNAPVEINTKTQVFFSSKDPNIIAYGELKKSGAMSAYEAFEIKLEYRDLARRPKYIILVASASKYGDYFTGYSGSVLLLDDFELVYE